MIGENIFKKNEEAVTPRARKAAARLKAENPLNAVKTTLSVNGLPRRACRLKSS